MWRRRLLALGLLLVIASCVDGSRSLRETDIARQPEAATSATLRKPAGGDALPATLRMAYLRTAQKAPGHDFVRDATGTLRSTAGGPGGMAAVAATQRGVRLSREGDGGFALGIETASVGRDGAARSRGVGGQRADGQELVLDREEGVEERYLAGPLGLEQSFVLRTRLEGPGPVAIEVAFAGLAATAAGGASDRVLLRDETGRVRAGYRDLAAADAEGRELAARMEVRPGGVVALVVDDTGASYPLRIDPLVWVQQGELDGSDGGAGDAFGLSVAVSGDIAIVGACNHQVGGNVRQGAAYVYVQSGCTWNLEAELTASDGVPHESFGRSVAVSGSTAIVGASRLGACGVAYVFERSGTTWSQEAELAPSGPHTYDCCDIVAVSGAPRSPAA